MFYVQKKKRAAGTKSFNFIKILEREREVNRKARGPGGGDNARGREERDLKRKREIRRNRLR